MKQNMGASDRIIRLIVAVAIVAVLYTSNIIGGVLATVLLVLAGIFTLTSLIGVCPLYMPFGFNTRKRSKS